MNSDTTPRSDRPTFPDPRWEEAMRQHPVAQIPVHERTVAQVIDLLGFGNAGHLLAQHSPPGYGTGVLLAYAEHHGFAPGDRAPERLRRLLAEALVRITRTTLNEDAFGRKSMTDEQWYQRQHAAMLRQQEERRAARLADELSE